MFNNKLILISLLFNFAITENIDLNIIFNEENNTLDVYMLNDTNLSGFQFFQQIEG